MGEKVEVCRGESGQPGGKGYHGRYCILTQKTLFLIKNVVCVLSVRLLSLLHQRVKLCRWQSCGGDEGEKVSTAAEALPIYCGRNGRKVGATCLAGLG